MRCVVCAAEDYICVTGRLKSVRCQALTPQKFLRAPRYAAPCQSDGLTACMDSSPCQCGLTELEGQNAPGSDKRGPGTIRWSSMRAMTQLRHLQRSRRECRTEVGSRLAAFPLRSYVTSYTATALSLRLSIPAITCQDLSSRKHSLQSRCAVAFCNEVYRSGLGGLGGFAWLAPHRVTNEPLFNTKDLLLVPSGHEH